MKYRINVEEILSREVIIEADSPEDAVDKAEELYFKEKIVLDYSDFENGSQTIKCKGICADSEVCTDFDYDGL